MLLKSVILLTHLTADNAAYAAVGRERAARPADAGGRALEHAARVGDGRRIVRRVGYERHSRESRQPRKHTPLFRALKVAHSCYWTIILSCWKNDN